MDNNSISSDLIRGHINTIILRALYDGDKYGYEICKEIEEKSSGQYELKQPTLYSSLKRLEKQGYVTGYWGGVSNGGRRRYFKLTEAGRAITEQNLAEWEYSRTVIDRLISSKDYDLTTPAPTGTVDFNLLRQATTRPPRLASEEPEDENEEETTDEEVFRDEAEEPSASGTAPATEPAADLADISAFYPEDGMSREEIDYRDILEDLIPAAEPEREPVSTIAAEPEPEPVPEPIPEPVPEPAPAAAEAPAPAPAEPEPISEPVPEPAPAPVEAPASVEDADDEYRAAESVYGGVDYTDIISAAKRDGFHVRIAGGRTAAERSEMRICVNRLRCNVSFVIYAIMLVELAIFGAISFGAAPFALTGYFVYAGCLAAIPLVFLILYLVEPQKAVINRFRLKNALATACIIMINCFLFVAVMCLIFGANLTNSGELIFWLIVPMVLLTNFPLSVYLYGALLKSMRYNAR